MEKIQLLNEYLRKNINSVPFEIQMELFKENKNYYLDLKKPSFEITKFFVDKHLKQFPNKFKVHNEGYLKLKKELEKTIKQIKNNLSNLDKKIICEFLKLTEEQQVEIISTHDTFLFLFIENPSEEIKKASIESNNWNILCYDNPSKELQLLAVGGDNKHEIIKLIDNPDDEVKIASLKSTHSWSLCHMEDASDEVIKQAILNNYNIYDDEYACFKSDVIKNKVKKYKITKEMKVQFVKKDPYVVFNLKKPSDDLFKIALDAYPDILRMNEELKISENILEYAFEKDVDNIRYIDNPSKEMQIKALSTNIDLFKSIKHPCHDAIVFYIEHKYNCKYEKIKCSEKICKTCDFYNSCVFELDGYVFDGCKFFLEQLSEQNDK